jgi:hypothetical protein
MLYNGQDHLTSSAAAAAAAAAAQFGLSRNLYHQLYPSPELAHLASWWPAAASLYNPLSNPHTFPFSSAAFSNYNAQQAAAAAAFSRFNPSFFLPPPSTSPSNSGTNSGNSQTDSLQSSNSNVSSSGHSRSGHSNNNNNVQSFMQSSRITNNDNQNGSSHYNHGPSNHQEHSSRLVYLLYRKLI